MRDQVREAVGDVFGLATADVPDDASVETIEGWDSLHHMELMLSLEMRFGVQMTTEVMPTLTSILAIEEYLQDEGVAPQT